MDKQELTTLINAWQGGDEAALEQFMPVLYDELRRLARGYMRGEAASHTLQATALVNEAFIRLADVDIDYADRTHFLAMAARTMRRVLVDHARHAKRAKRGGGARKVTLEEDAVLSHPKSPAVLDLDRALDALAEMDGDLAACVELVFFGGLTYDEAATALGKSRTAVYDDMQLAKAWLRRHMADAGEPGQSRTD